MGKGLKLVALITLIVLAIAFAYRRDPSMDGSASDTASANVEQDARPDSPNYQRTKASADVDANKFEICGRDRYHCVVDGDTFILDGAHVRIADIDAPEIGGAKCEYERKLGLRAKSRLAELLNEGPFRLQSIDRDVDRYGRKLRVVTRNGHSLGDDLIKEGLARSWGGGKKPWC